MVAFKNMTMHYAASIANFYKQAEGSRRGIHEPSPNRVWTASIVSILSSE
jgi:hypothetical protein